MTRMTLLSVNAGLPLDLTYRGKPLRSAIYKDAIAGRAMLRREQLDGDGQADRRVHGGVDMAVYAYPFEHYDFWRRAIGRDNLPFGQFGENLTVAGMAEDSVRIGDVLRMGEAVVQVSEPRIPCFKLVMRMAAGGDFSGRFHKSRRLGYYLRVIEEGLIGAGDPIEFVERAEASPTVAEFIEISQFGTDDLAGLRRMQAARGLSAKWMATLQKHIDRLAPEAPAAPSAAAHVTCEVVCARSGVTLGWDGGARHLLGLLEQAGLRPAFGCRSGSCQTCLTRILEGEIEYTEPVEPPEAGSVLLCSAAPKGARLVLDA